MRGEKFFGNFVFLKTNSHLFVLEGKETWETILKEKKELKNSSDSSREKS